MTTTAARPSSLSSADETSSNRHLTIDCDSHFLEPEVMWTEYLEARFRPMAPRYELDSMGQRRLLIGGKTLPRNPSVPLPRRNYTGMLNLPADVKLSGSDPHARLKVMDSEGVDVNVMYPTRGLFFGSVIEDTEFLVALCRAYNNWARDFCSAAPDRLLAHAVVPQFDVFATIAETRRAVEELGMAGVMLRPNPIGRTVEDPAWEPLWALLEELQTPLGFHEGTSLCVPFLGSDRTDNYLFQHAMSHPFEHMAAMLSLIGGGILERHPTMKVLFLEAGCGWVPYWLERIDQHLVGEWAYADVELSLSATEYFKRQCFVSMDPEERGVVQAFVECLGADNLCWSTDFPHMDHDWRGMARDFAGRDGLSDVEKAKILGGNAARVYELA